MEGILRKQELAEIDRRFAESFDFGKSTVYYPVRHHSPACAWHLRQVIGNYKPELILIEGPADSMHLLPHIADAVSEPPFCIYYSFDDRKGQVSEEKEKYRAYYPFLEYSPELVAIREAFAHGIPVRFIDMPYASRLINTPQEQVPPDTQFFYNEDTEYERNSYTSMLARRSGCRSFSEFWESHFELHALQTDYRSFVRNVFHLGYFMRLTSASPPAEDIQREAYMAASLRKELPHYQRILIITGAFHVTGLMDALSSAETNVSWKEAESEAVSSYLMPYTFREADSQSGYAAGMPFPAFYQSVWEQMQKRRHTDLFEATILDYIIKTARFARQSQNISLPDEINAFGMARSLAALRGKPATGVYELLDSVRSCFIKGDIHSTSTFEVQFLHCLLSGMGAGKVAAGACTPPVVKEFRAQCVLHRLKTSTVERQEVTLDIIKTPAHYRKSRFLHQLRFLETGFAELQSGPDYVNRRNRNLVREHWYCRYSTQVETRLIDLSVFGTTLSQVCASLIEKQFKDHLGTEELGRLLISVQVMGVEGFYRQYEASIMQVIEQEKNFMNHCKLLADLFYLSHMQRLMDGDVQPLVPQMIDRSFREAVGQIALVKQATADEEQAVCEQLRNLYHCTLDHEEWTRKAFLQEEIDKVLEDGFCNSRFYGVCLGIHAKEKQMDATEFCNRITAYLESSIGQPEQAASFVCGLFLITRDVLFTDDRILATLDHVIGRADHESFLAILPNLRYAFTCFLPTEVQRLGKMVAEYHQITESNLFGSLVLSQTEAAEAALLDARAAQALNEWNL